MDDRRLLDRFRRLCEIPSPTGSERAVADAVLGELRELGIEAGEDDAAEAAGAGAGNVVARIPGRGDGWVMFAAHLDTVPVVGPIEVVEDGGAFRSAGETILGADDKAGVAVLLELAARAADFAPAAGLELVFTVAEETGMRGARELDTAALRSALGFVLDNGGPVGALVTASPTHKRLSASFRGREAHAGIEPEAGHSAVAAAAAAVAAMKLGRLDDETTANVGVIQGGTAPNVVPGSCLIEGEARSVDGARAATVVGEMADACTWAATEHGCDVDVEVGEEFRGYRIDASSAPLAIAEAALARLGREPARLTTGAGSDANALLAAGFDCLLITSGSEADHTPDESITVAALTTALEICEAIVKETAGAEA
ncbi:MAG: M20/M25/M40 family metallo-hydrolase [Solirubrobacterales bacterium]|nr:M20/M25/M40 family metallo-hydrolase [Solirubrobacterales bacterium]